MTDPERTDEAKTAVDNPLPGTPGTPGTRVVRYPWGNVRRLADELAWTLTHRMIHACQA